MACERLYLGFLGLALWASQAPSVSPNITDFQKRVADYMKLRKNAASGVSSLKTTDSPENFRTIRTTWPSPFARPVPPRRRGTFSRRR